MQSDSHSGASPSPDGELESIDRATSSEPTYYQSEIVPRPHPKHDNCPDTLDCLPDTEGRPQHTLPVILRCAILGSPKQRLTIREIYAAMEKKYSYYTTAGPAWKVSERLLIISFGTWEGPDPKKIFFFLSLSSFFAKKKKSRSSLVSFACFKAICTPSSIAQSSLRTTTSPRD